jgi:hypothetical protein
VHPPARSIFAVARQIDGLLHGQIPGMEQVQIRKIRCQQLAIRQTGAGIFSSKPGNIQRSLHRILQGLI